MTSMVRLNTYIYSVVYLIGKRTTDITYVLTSDPLLENDILIPTT